MPARPNCESNEFDLTIDRFESLWYAGHVPDLKEFLSNDTSESLLSRKGDLLVELVMVDIEYRWRRKDAKRGNSRFPAHPVVEDYIAAFPELSSTNDLSKVIASEYRTRHRWGDQPAHDEYRTRFPKLAGACQKPCHPSINAYLVTQQRAQACKSVARIVMLSPL